LIRPTNAHEYELYLAIENIDHFLPDGRNAHITNRPHAWWREQRPHQGRWCYGKTPMETFIDTLPIAKEKLMQAA
jgi:hypothetical protein